MLSLVEQQELEQYTNLRFINPLQYNDAKLFSAREKNLYTEEEYKQAQVEVYGRVLYMPSVGSVSSEIVEFFRDTGYVPIDVSSITSQVMVIKPASVDLKPISSLRYDIVVHEVTLYDYIREYIKVYGQYADLLEVPAKILLEDLVTEAISLKAADITITQQDNYIDTFFNVQGIKVNSKRVLTRNTIPELKSLLCFENPVIATQVKPVYSSFDISERYRGRAVYCPSYHGVTITIRILDNLAFDKKLDDLHIHKPNIEMLRKYFYKMSKGLNLIVGPTMSGKNTTALAILNELALNNKIKIVSIESPVEQLLKSITQISVDVEEDIPAVVSSLIRQNPDYIYITETSEASAKEVMQVANTGKAVLTTLHANSCTDALLRLSELTGTSLEKCIQVVTTIVYQELKNVNGKLQPLQRYVYLSPERKVSLVRATSLQDMQRLISTWEGGDIL